MARNSKEIIRACGTAKYFRDVKKIKWKVMEKEKCTLCGKEVSSWELKRYNGICAICFARNANRKRRKPRI